MSAAAIIVAYVLIGWAFALLFIAWGRPAFLSVFAAMLWPAFVGLWLWFTIQDDIAARRARARRR